MRRRSCAGPADDDLAPYLAPEPFIESDDPDIRAAAEEAVRERVGTARAGGSADALRQCDRAEKADRQPAVGARSAADPHRRLQRAHGAVRRHVEGGSAYRRGLPWAWRSCAARSTTTPGRRSTSTKAPTRGFWLPVDPTFNQFPADATHFRLARGGLDKQAAIIPLIGRVKITVIDLEVVAESHADSRRTGGSPSAGAPIALPAVAARSRAGACRASWVVTNDCDSESAETVRRVHGRRRRRSRRAARERFTAFSDRTAPGRPRRSG